MVALAIRLLSRAAVRGREDAMTLAVCLKCRTPNFGAFITCKSAATRRRSVGFQFAQAPALAGIPASPRVP